MAPATIIAQMNVALSLSALPPARRAPPPQWSNGVVELWSTGDGQFHGPPDLRSYCSCHVPIADCLQMTLVLVLRARTRDKYNIEKVFQALRFYKYQHAQENKEK